MKRLIILMLMGLSLWSAGQTSSPVFNWRTQEISKNNNLQGMAVHNENTAVIAGYGGTFSITSDGGATWNDVGLLNPTFNFIDMSIAGETGYLVARKASIVKYPAGGDNDIYTDGIVLKTTDEGKHWSLFDLSAIGEGTDPGQNPNVKGCISLDPFSVLTISDTEALLFLQWYDVISATKKNHSAVFKTIDGGIKWTAITPDLGGAYVTTLRKNNADIYIGGNKILRKTSVGSDVVTDLFPALSAVAGANVFVNDVRFYNNHIFVQTVTGSFVSADQGNTFEKIEGLTGGNDIIKLDDNVILSLGSSSASKATIDGGKTWTSCYPGGTCFEIPGVFNDSLYALTSSVVYKIATADLKLGNYKWTSFDIGKGSGSLQKMQIFDEQNALMVGYGQLAKSTGDKGLSWTNVDLPVLFSGADFDFRSVSSSGDAGYLTTRSQKLVDFATGEDYYLNGLIFNTADAWKTWTAISMKNVGKDAPNDASKNPAMTGCYAADNYTIACADANTAFLYVAWFDSVSVAGTATKHSRVFKTADGGNSWTAITRDFGSAIVASIKFSGETGYLAGNKILLKTTDGGETFTDLYPKIALGTDSNLFINSVVLESVDKLYCQTSNNKGLFYTADGGLTFTKVSGVNGGFDFVPLDANSFMSLGSSTANKFTNDGGATWTDCQLGTTIFASGGVFNDSLYVLGKSNLYKVAVADLDISTFTAEIKLANPMKVMYGPSDLVLTSAGSNIDRLMIYTVSGQLMAINEPKAQTCRIAYSSFRPGIYLLAAFIDGERYTQKVVFK